MAPEYVMHGEFSVKSDVFSFGVLVLEIISGQKNSGIRHGENTEDLLSFVSLPLLIIVCYKFSLKVYQFILTYIYLLRKLHSHLYKLLNETSYILNELYYFDK